MWNKNLVSDSCVHFPSGGSPTSHIGECSASILVIGEAPGKQENLHGVPFVGAAGRILHELIASAGLSRSDLYLTNVIPWQPPGNNFDLVPPDIRARGAKILERKIAAFTGAVVVPLGAHALSATSDKRGIMKWRGSVLPTVNGKSWMVPSIHPAAVLRQTLLKKTCRYDWKRIAQIAERGWEIPAYKLVVTTWNDHRLLALLSAPALSFDIETIRGTSKILCISFAASETEAFSIDCRHGIPPLVRELLESNIPKIAQNGLFDCYVLARNGITVNNFRFDTALMFHALDNAAGPVTSASAESGRSIIKPYSLAYIASIFTPFIYWKDSGKDSGEGEAFSKKVNWIRFSEYNAMDSLGTFVAARELRKRLIASGRYDFYKEQYERFLYPLLDLSLRGVRFDASRAAAEVTVLRRRLVDLRDNVESSAGRPLRTIKAFKKEPKVKEGRKDKLVIVERDGVWYGERRSISGDHLKKYLYGSLSEGGLGLKRQVKDGKLTVDEIAIRNLLLYVAEGGDSRHRYRGNRDLARSVLEGLLAFRETEKTIQFINGEALDDDNRIRAAYSLNVQTGRLRSAGNACGTGYNLQNIQRNVRHYFIPDEGADYFVEIDLKQAEDLVVKTIAAAVTNDDRPLQLVRAVHDGSMDIHRRLASVVFSLPPAEIDYEKRYVAKRCRHARNNGMKHFQMQRTLLKDGFVYTALQCQQILRAVDEAEPWVPEFHKAIRRAIMRQGGIATSWGWQLKFDDERLSDASVFNRGYCYIEQSEVGVLLKQYGLLTYTKEIAPFFKTRLNMLVHDNLVMSVPRNELYEVIKIVHENLTQERAYGIYHPSGCACGNCDRVATRLLSIPAEVKISKRLACTCDQCKKEKKPFELGNLPTKEAFWEAFEAWENG